MLGRLAEPVARRMNEHGKDVKNLEDDLRAVLEEPSHSELLDPDPDHRKRSRERLKYLREINAIGAPEEEAPVG